MRLDMKRDAELDARKGSAKRTILATIWLALCFGAAYFFTSWLFDAGGYSLIRIRSMFFVPGNIPNWIVHGAMLVIIVIVMQFFVLIGWAFSSPTGKQRPGEASAHSNNPDPFDKYDYH